MPKKVCNIDPYAFTGSAVVFKTIDAECRKIKEELEKLKREQEANKK